MKNEKELGRHGGREGKRDTDSGNSLCKGLAEEKMLLSMPGSLIDGDTEVRRKAFFLTHGKCGPYI